MKTIILGDGFVASHFDFKKISIRLKPSCLQISSIIDQEKPDVIINCIGYCGKKNIDDCELEKSKTVETNITIPLIIANECEKRGIHFIHIGSGCINYGPSPNVKNGIDFGWKESDFSSPLSFYSKTKYAADLGLSGFSSTTVLRIRMPISDKNNPRNLLNKIISYKKIVEEKNSITFMDDFVNATNFVIEKKCFGIYNVVNNEPLFHSDLLNEYKKYVPSHEWESISNLQLNNIVYAQRSNCILDNSKIKTLGFKFENTHTRVQEVIKKFYDDKNSL